MYIKYATPPCAVSAMTKPLFSLALTVRIAPSTMKLKLKVCCVALDAFSFPVRSPHGTLPSSLNGVTAFLLRRKEAFDVPKPVSVPYNRAARMGRRLGGHFRIDTGRRTKFMLTIDIALRLSIVLKTKLLMFSREASRLMWGSELVRFGKAA